MSSGMRDDQAIEHVRKLTTSAMELTDKLLDDLDDRSGFSVDVDTRSIIRADWIVLIGKHLIDNHSPPAPEKAHEGQEEEHH